MFSIFELWLQHHINIIKPHDINTQPTTINFEDKSLFIYLKAWVAPPNENPGKNTDSI